MGQHEYARCLATCESFNFKFFPLPPIVWKKLQRRFHFGKKKKISSTVWLRMRKFASLWDATHKENFPSLFFTEKLDKIFNFRDVWTTSVELFSQTLPDSLGSHLIHADYPLISVGALSFLSMLQFKHLLFSVELIVEQFSQVYWKSELTLPISTKLMKNRF